MNDAKTGAAGVTSADVTRDHVLTSAALLGLRIDPAWHDTVLFNLKLLTDAAALVDGFPLDEAVEPAPVFTP